VNNLSVSGLMSCRTTYKLKLSFSEAERSFYLHRIIRLARGGKCQPMPTQNTEGLMLKPTSRGEVHPRCDNRGALGA
jgi:hypothetical protein